MKRIKMNVNGDAQKESVSPESFFDRIMDVAENKRMEIPERHEIRPQFTIYKIKGDGHRIVATSPADFLHQLRTGSRFDSQGTDDEYMVRFAHRLQELEGYLVSTDSPDAFLTDLITHGFAVAE